MNDKELLELAAKAAGIKHPDGDHSISNDGRLWDCNGLRWWYPLTDDGDALRLAVKLMDFEPYMSRGAVPFIKNDMVATRRAIVRAAAEIGKTK
jgi:hypothetical protein